MADAESPVSMKQANELVELGKQSSRFANPNPNGVGCPADSTLQAMAQRSRNLNLADAPVAHVANCSPCYQLYCRYRRENRRRHAVFAVCAAAVIIVAVLIGRNGLRGPADNPKLAAVDSQTPKAKENGPPAERPQPQLIALDLRNISPSRGDDTELRKAPETILPAKALRLDVTLPVASPAGPYELGIFTVSHGMVLAATGSATLENGLTKLSVSMDLRNLKEGRYVIGLRSSLSDWMFAPLTIR